MKQAGQFLRKAATLANLRSGMERGAELARADAAGSIVALGALCNVVAAGERRCVEAYEEVSRAAHLAAFNLMTYGEMGLALAILPEEYCLRLMQAGEAMQARALVHQELFRAQSLSPSDVFYDDLLSPADLQVSHTQALLGYDLLDADVQTASTAGALAIEAITEESFHVRPAATV